MTELVDVKITLGANKINGDLREFVARAFKESIVKEAEVNKNLQQEVFQKLIDFMESSVKSTTPKDKHTINTELLDYFAGQLSGSITHEKGLERPALLIYDDHTDTAYVYADAMLTPRKKYVDNAV